MALLALADALARVLEDVDPLPAIEAPLAEAYGRVLAADVAALRTQPPDDVSAMDGYAVRGADVVSAPTRLKLVGEVAAGRPLNLTIGPGEAARIFTGGVMPPGTDTVIIQEETSREDDVVVIGRSSPARHHVRPKGLDFKTGQVLLDKGHRLNDRDLALAAGMNHPTLPVHRRPRLALLATGDELVAPGSDPGPGEIVYSNGFALAALTTSEGAEVTDLGIVPDQLSATLATIRKARDLNIDVLVTTGGISVGEYDLVQQALRSEGLDLSFWRVAVRPGRPMMHGKLGSLQVLGLPGNPVSSYVCAVLFLVPLIRRLSGRSDLNLAHEWATLGRDLPANDERADYMRSALSTGADGRLVATPFLTQDSSMMATLAQAGCLVIREPFAPAVKAGSRCPIVKLSF